MATTKGAYCADRRAQAEAALAQYPDIDRSRLDDLLRWMKKEASAMEIALLSGDPVLGRPYRQLREDHLDRLSLTDWISFLILFFAGGALFLALVWIAR